MSLPNQKAGKKGSRSAAESPVTVRAVQTQTPGRAFAGIFALCCCVVAGAAITLLAQPTEGGMPFFPVSVAEANTVPQTEMAATMTPTMITQAVADDSFSVAAMTDELNARIAASLPPLIRDTLVPRPADPVALKRGLMPAFTRDTAPVAAPTIMPSAVARAETAEVMQPAVAPIRATPTAL